MVDMSIKTDILHVSVQIFVAAKCKQLIKLLQFRREHFWQKHKSGLFNETYSIRVQILSAKWMIDYWIFVWRMQLSSLSWCTCRHAEQICYDHMILTKTYTMHMAANNVEAKCTHKGNKKLLLSNSSTHTSARPGCCCSRGSCPLT